MQRLDGDGMVFVHAGGTVIDRTLAPGETLHVDTGCIVALASTVDYDIKFVGGVKSAIFGGEGFFFASLRGPGTAGTPGPPGGGHPLGGLAEEIEAALPEEDGKWFRVSEGGVTLITQPMLDKRAAAL